MASRGSNAPGQHRGNVDKNDMLAQVVTMFNEWKKGLKMVLDGTLENTDYTYEPEKYKNADWTCTSGFAGDDSTWRFSVTHYAHTDSVDPLLREISTKIQDGTGEILFSNGKRLINLINNIGGVHKKRSIWAIEKDNNTSFVVTTTLESDFFAITAVPIAKDDYPKIRYDWKNFMHYSTNVPELKNFHARAVRAVQELIKRGFYVSRTDHVHDINTGSCAKCGKQILAS
jgi:hypothetical protein